jgi:chorismate lyase/3-hydroxybenzoate synthase
LPANKLTAEAPRISDRNTSTNLDCNASIRVTYGLPVGNEDLLAAIYFGRSRATHHVLSIEVRLESLIGSPHAELWWADGPVQRGHAGAIRYASDARHLFGVIELDEREYGGIANATAFAYEAIANFQAQSGFPHLLRMWNYFDAINEGAGDLEQYRQFCIGRSRGLGLGALDASAFPAATAIGHQQETHQLQVFWLASKTPGTAIENPRQVSAYRYPRQHGPVSPTFARATVAADGTLLISGTASIVGHSSVHDDNTIAQLDETLRNLSALRALATTAPAARTLFKVYVRDAAHADSIATRLRCSVPAKFQPCEVIYLAADICRRELLVEIEALQLTQQTG